MSLFFSSTLNERLFFHLNILPEDIKSNILSNITHMIVQTYSKNNMKIFSVHGKASKNLILRVTTIYLIRGPQLAIMKFQQG
jgi:hypothetical protein